tara:strand:+ start:10009 stop:10236 length:228 start_codon:yes stop_codon:yes gene_type:complete
MSNQSSIKILETTYKNQRFRIKEDLPAVGWYLYVFDKNENCIADHLQDSLEIVIEEAFEEYQVPKNSWTYITSEK